ncbi:hypothetical protein GGS20DRAFT_533660 [Poronia punctata]|nr:hypothetical protein GGS20DRAFT_533660 [Poronia punctata]
MDTEDSSSTTNGVVGGGAGVNARVSVACLSCRSRHVRCDARQPSCMRCSAEGKTCQYVKSRRGGLDRARLAERRRVTDSPSRTREEETETQLTFTSSSGPGNRKRRVITQAQFQSDSDNGNEAGNNNTSTSTPSSSLNDLAVEEFSSVETDLLVGLFYKHFHPCHPCVLPRHTLHQLHSTSTSTSTSTSSGSSITLLISILRFIGSLYSYSNRDLTSQLNTKIIQGFLTQHPPDDAYLVQCHLLYSIALYWSAEKTESRKEIDAAISLALDLGMHRRDFALEHGGDDVVVQESLRRTWWVLYCTDAYYAAIKRRPTFPLCDVDTDTELPCEEDEYESGSIPSPPKTLEDFDTREFTLETQKFSSFAYLIGATRSIALALSAGSPNTESWLSPTTIAEVDAIIDSWFLLLPKEKMEVLKEGNVVDELMFQAHMAVHANLIALHRPFSRLPYHPLEGKSSCLVEPPPSSASASASLLPGKDDDSSSSSPETTAHTQRCLQSVEAQLRLLVLPAPPFRRSPFTVCMTAAGTNTLLAAIGALFAGRRKAVARHQLRLVLGYIRALASVWPQGRYNLVEIQTIAQEVLAPKHRLQSVTSSAGWDGTVAKTTQVQVQVQTPQTPPDMAPVTDGLAFNWSNPALDFGAQEGHEPFWGLDNELQHDIPIWFSSFVT